MNGLKILHIIPNLGKGGAERMCLETCIQLKKDGHIVKLLILEDINEYQELSSELSFDFIDVLKEFSIRKHRTKVFEEFKCFIQEYNPDVVHTHLFAAEMVWKLTKISIPTLFHIHDNIKVFTPFRTGLFNKVSWFTLYEKRVYLMLLKKQPTYFLCVSNETQQYINARIKPYLNNIGIIHNSINTSTFDCLPRKEFSEIKLISVGSLITLKGHKLLLQVVSELIRLTSKKITLTLLGDGVLKGELELYALELDIKDLVLFKGKVERPQDYLKRANVYVHGAFKESFGLVLIEAMASNLPVFTTDGGGNRDVIEHEKTGFIYSERNAAKMALDIYNLTENPIFYHKIISQAKKYSENFNIIDYSSELTVLYRNLISRETFSPNMEN
jgi:glycosyltransferase involved in cell wall biosynthesis